MAETKLKLITLWEKKSKVVWQSWGVISWSFVAVAAQAVPKCLGCASGCVPQFDVQDSGLPWSHSCTSIHGMRSLGAGLLVAMCEGWKKHGNCLNRGFYLAERRTKWHVLHLNVFLFFHVVLIFCDKILSPFYIRIKNIKGKGSGF